jgi:hypothetical protein
LWYIYSLEMHNYAKRGSGLPIAEMPFAGAFTEE